MMNGFAPLPVKSGFVERDVDVVVLFNIVGGDFAIDAAELQNLISSRTLSLYVASDDGFIQIPRLNLVRIMMS